MSLKVKVSAIGLLDMLKFKNQTKVREKTIEKGAETPLPSSYAANALAEKMHPRAQKMTVCEIIPRADDVKTFVLRTENGQSAAPFSAGQYISFSMEAGNALAIIGSSGSGKTTLLRCLNFLETPDSGTITVGGELLFDAADPNTQKERDIRKKRLHFGMVFQSFNLFPQYTALQNVMLASQLLAKERPDFKQNKKQIFEEIEATAQQLLGEMGLANRAGHYPHQLSGGQQQRVAIARALALHPDILCFDEPTSALDPELTGEVLKVIRGLADQNTTMVIVTHEMAFARDVADQVIFMDGGVIVEQGEARQVIEHPTQERTKQFLSRYAEN